MLKLSLRYHPAVHALFGALTCVSLHAEEANEPDPRLAFLGDFKPFLTQYCVDCHGNDNHKADLNLEKAMRDGAPVIEDRRLWKSVFDMVESHEMPPEKKPQPKDSEREMAIAYLDAALESFQCHGVEDPGTVTIRRLNRVEYENTIRDLLGVTFKATESFPRDEVGYGFDNIGSLLSVSPLLMEKYLDAAEEIVDKALLSSLPEWPPVSRLEENDLKPEKSDDDAAVRVDRGYLGFFREAEAKSVFKAPTAGAYALRIRAYQDKAGGEPARLRVRVNRETLKEFDVTARARKPDIYEVTAQLPEGPSEISVAYTNNFNQDGDRNLYVDYVAIQGPLGTERPPLPETHRRVIPREPAPGEEKAFAEEILTKFASRAYRRPATPEDVAPLTTLFQSVRLDEGAPFEEAIKVALQAVLVSPHFLYRWEMDPVNGEGIRELNGYELAARLSYFLWSSMPDEALFEAAEKGDLEKDAGVIAQVERLLKDPKASALVDNFAGQWLQIRNVDSLEVDTATFPEFDDDLRQAMRRETELFVRDIVERDADVLELLDSDHTFLNERLAQHYGIPGVDGPAFRKVVLPSGSRRGGVLTQASILTLTSNPTRTSPVNRGKWVLEQILGTPPPPPPANVAPLPEGKEASELASLRERLEQHRASPECAGCHAKMDPIGLALENYDAIGRWRDLDGKFPIDPSGELSGGIHLEGPEDLKRVLRGKEEFLTSIAEKMLIYALGRGTEYHDLCAIDGILERMKAENRHFSALIKGIVLSDPFRKRNLDSKH